MLVTPLGKIEIRIDGELMEYEINKIPKNNSCMVLSGCFLLSVEFIPDGEKHTLSCEISGYTACEKDGVESGESLELKSFYSDNVKLSIGMEGDMCYLPDGTRDSKYDYDNGYSENGVCFEILPNTKTQKYVFAVAWIENYNDRNEIQTWFGADPTMI